MCGAAGSTDRQEPPSSNLAARRLVDPRPMLGRTLALVIGLTATPSRISRCTINKRRLADGCLGKRSLAVKRRRIAVLLILLPLTSHSLAQTLFAREREQMLEEIDTLARLTAGETGRTQLSPRVRQAIQKVPRHRFVPDALQGVAYASLPLPIGEGQTISEPFIVALMTELLDIEPSDRILEVGTGSGYQAAILSLCAQRVYSIEIIRSLGEGASARLAELGYRNVEIRIGDGYDGWPEAAPFDRILVTAAPDHVPQPLIEQLKPGGRMVVPVGARYLEQDLLVISKDAKGRVVTQSKLAVRFVPMTRDNKPINR